MKSFIKSLFLLVALLPLSLMVAVSCDDDPGVENRYTSTSEYAADFLQNRDTTFSEFVQILKRTSPSVYSLLATYGSYTVFAPTNSAVDVYLAGRGLSSVDELSQADCDTLAWTHVIEGAAYFTTDFNDGTYSTMNMNDRPLTVTCDSDTISVPGEVRLAVYINKTARMISMDDSVENGVVHTLNAVLSTSADLAPTVLAQDSSISLFYQALVLTHMTDSISRFKDQSYDDARSATFLQDSTDWTNDALVFSTASEYDNVAYMKHRYYKYTIFTPRNEVFEEKYNVHNLDELIEFAKSLYDPVYPDDASVSDPTDRRNSLNRFVSYHMLDRQATYYQLTCVDGPNSTLAQNFLRNKWDIADWYETMMPHSIIKCSFPSGSASGLYINRRGVQARADGRGYKIRGALVIPASQVDVDQTFLNGVYHYIDDVLSFGLNPSDNMNNVQETVFNERLRIDCSTLSPDFMTSGARGHYTNSSDENGKYGVWDATANHNNKQTCLGFQPGSAKNFTFDEKTHVHVRPRTLGFWSYQADEVTVKGRYDLVVKLPPVPAGDWELRMGSCIGFTSRGIVQYYLATDESCEGKVANLAWQPQGIPFDMRQTGADVGNTLDATLGSEEQIAAFDKQFHYKGWMKGPASYRNGASATVCRQWGPTGSVLLRKVIGVFHSNGKEDHYLRMQQKLESETNEMNFDFIELCPSSVYNNPDVAEDRL